jgi:hypothetical protein
MNDLRQAAEMALKALEIWEKMQPNTSASAVRVPAIQALRQALAEPEWVGLTKEDFYKKDDETVFVLGMKFAEARLKEKNT